jgi:hypothetical protein
MVAENGSQMVRGISGAKQATWFRIPSDDQVQHALWLFDREADAQQASASFEALREMPDAPSEFVSSDVCEVIGHAVTESAPPGSGAAMTRWDYTWYRDVHIAHPNTAMEKVMDTATKWGADGWEMVNFSILVDRGTGLSRESWHVAAVFKRPKTG